MTHQRTATSPDGTTIAWSRVGGLRRADHEVVLGVWELLLTQPADEIARAVWTS